MTSRGRSDTYHKAEIKAWTRYSHQPTGDLTKPRRAVTDVAWGSPLKAKAYKFLFRPLVKIGLRFPFRSLISSLCTYIVTRTYMWCCTDCWSILTLHSIQIHNELPFSRSHSKLSMCNVCQSTQNLSEWPIVPLQSLWFLSGFASAYPRVDTFWTPID